MVSHVARQLLEESPVIARRHFQAEADPYDKERNSEGYLNLGTAENRLLWDLLEPVLTAPRQITASDTRYAQLHGLPETRAVLAHQMSRWSRAPVDADELVVVSGATSALDICASTLCDPGDALVVPTPCYGAFPTDLGGRSGARIVAAPLTGRDRFALSLDIIERAVERARREGSRVAAVVVTSPHNPVGQVYDAALLHDLTELAADLDVDLLADEIYANSVFGSRPFVSLLDPVVNRRWAERTHVVWGMAKDFGVPGLKVGVLHTRHEAVAAAARALAYFAPVSTDTQALVTRLLGDDEWVDQFLEESRSRLGSSYTTAATALTDHGIPHLPAEAGFSVWCDLRGWLPEHGFSGEEALAEQIFTRGRVNILPGGAFLSSEPGWFRLCHTTSAELVVAGIERIRTVLADVQPAPFLGPSPTTRRRSKSPGPSGRPDRAGPFARWYETAGVRSGPRRWFHDEADQGKVFYPEHMVWYMSHDAVQGLAPERRNELACRHLYQFLLATTHLETAVVNRAAERIASARSGIDVPTSLRLDAYRVYCDEGYHALYSLDLVDQIEAATGIEVPPWDYGGFLEDLEATCRRLLPDAPVLAQLLQAVVFETLITAVLNELPRQSDVVSTVRTVLEDHARDESRHQRFFSSFFHQLWHHLDSDLRPAVAAAIPAFIHDCVRSDDRFANVSLVLAGLDPSIARQVLADVQEGPGANQRVRDVARGTLRMCRSAGVFEVPGAPDAFAALGLDP